MSRTSPEYISTGRSHYDGDACELLLFFFPLYTCFIRSTRLQNIFVLYYLCILSNYRTSLMMNHGPQIDRGLNLTLVDVLSFRAHIVITLSILIME